MLKKLKIYYLFVSLPFVMLLIGAGVFFEGIKYTIHRNPHPQINYTIFMIILVGGVIILFNSRRLMHEARTIVDFSKAIHAKNDSVTLKEKTNGYTGDLACITQMVAASSDRSISHQEQAALEHELANVRSRLNRRNALPQYLTGLLVGMGLLGTFIGLLATLNDISILITSFADLDMASVNPIEVFSTMITRMKAPMQSMAIAFSASMFGLLGSIILGLMMVGIRRLQNDIFSLLSSEVARHIEIALSFESLSFKGREVSTGDLSTDILLRIEERLAESARTRQRALSAEMDDFKKQRGEMLRALTEQTAANNNFQGEMQQLGGRLGAILDIMEKGGSEVSSQISDLTVNLAGEAKKTHKLLAAQVEEQKELRDTLDSYKIEERLAEAARQQQRALSAEMDEFKNQRGEMLRVLTEQTAASNNFHAELEQLGGRLGAIFNVMEKGNDDICGRISDLTVRLSADAKQAQVLLNSASNNFSTELQKLGSQLDGQLGAISGVMAEGTGELGARVSELAVQLSADARQSQEQCGEMLRNLGEQLGAADKFRSELAQMGGQLGTIVNTIENGNGELGGRISELTAELTGEAKESHAQRIDLLRNLTEQLEVGNNFCSELKRLGGQLGDISTVMEKDNRALVELLSELIAQMNNDAGETRQLLDKGNDRICSQISDLTVHMVNANEPPLLPLNGDEVQGDN